MSIKLKKRAWTEFSREEVDHAPFYLKGKTLLTQEGEHSRLEFHLNNLVALFPEISDSTVKEIYTRCGRNIDQTLTELEKIQNERKELGMPLITPQKTPEESIQEKKAIERELKSELTGLEQTNENALRRLKNDAGKYISQAVGYLSNCKSTEEAEEVLLNFLDCTLGETIGTYQEENRTLRAKYIIAKEAVHLQSNKNAKLEKEKSVLRKMNEKYYHDRSVLADLNKRMLRELEDRDLYRANGSQFGPNRDVY